MKLPREYIDVWEAIDRHWQNYGGTRAVLRSPYLHCAIVFALLFFPYRYPVNGTWWDFSTDILPNILGFSLGGYAIFLAFGDEKFKRLMAWKKQESLSDEGEASPYLSISVSFLQFIIVQLLALLFGIIGKTTDLVPVEVDGMGSLILNILIYGMGLLSFSIFTYALFLALAATFAIYRLVWLYDKFLQQTCDENE
jgi:hypothetical protein